MFAVQYGDPPREGQGQEGTLTRENMREGAALGVGMSEEKASERADGMEAALEVKATGVESLTKEQSADEEQLSNLTSSVYASGGEAAQFPALDESSAPGTSSGDSNTSWTW